jgi:peptide/nickel transport system permease protein
LWRFLIARLAATVPVLFVVSVAVFGLIHISPGDPAAIIAGELSTPEEVARIRERLGLDRPLLLQYGEWIGRVVGGDLGRSLFSTFAVRDLIAQRIEPTLMLALATMVWTLLFAVPLGILAAVHARRWIDRAVMGISVLGFSVPSFVIAYLLVYAFAATLGWFPVQGYQPLARGLGPFLNHIALPSLTLGLVYTALIARMTRASLLEVLAQDYIRTANAKGLPPRKVVLVHALKVAAVPIVTTIGMGFALLIGGVVITERVFGIPGLGRLTVDAILRRDYPIIQGVLLVFAFSYVVVNLVVDVIYVLVDPRIRY